MELRTAVESWEFLHRKTQKVEKIDGEILATLDAMLEFMYQHNGIGLAANQVGLDKSLVVIDLRENEIRKPLYLINPEVVYFSPETQLEEEGCLSVPDQRAVVKRSTSVKVKFTNRDGVEEIITADGLLAVCLQHEIDHLNGILYVDYLSKIRRDMLLKKAKKFMAAGGYGDKH